ncbi:MAG: UDP-N-acetylmuramoyl-tripeptide--D-alanyl-D-alanine ligase [Candidatus Omnitrophica bacterium]|nr:UDP-N-acetylmuramoyl-tripeptide--D-alanyl-D-alanine ligase [Candidatus Omnitrophota bacterium]
MAAFLPEEVERATGGMLLSGSPVQELAGVSIDSRTIRPGDLFVAIRGRRFDGHDFLAEAFSRRAAGAIVDRWPLEGGLRPGPHGPIWRVKDTLQALGDLARFHRRRFDLKVAAITGSSGKSTTKTMLAHLLCGNPEEILATPGTQNNLIGTPLTLFKLHRGHRAAVLELGTNQWGEIRRLTQIVRPTVGVITQIGPAHLETFGDLQGVLRAKGEMWEEMDPDGPLVLPADDPLLWEVGRRLARRVVWFGCRPEAELRASRIEWEPWGCRALVNDRWELRLPLPGHHNLMNALAALAAAQVLGEDAGLGVERMASVPPLPGRLSRLEWEGCLVIDDSYNANPASLAAALEVFRRLDVSGRRVAVIGDMLELGDQARPLHAEGGRRVASSGIDFLIGVGPLAQVLLAAAREAGFPEEGSRAFGAAEEAGEFLVGWIRPGDAVLLKGSRGMQMERVLECWSTSSTR